MDVNPKTRIPKPESQRRLLGAMRFGWPRRAATVLGFGIWVLGIGILGAGCAKARAQTVPDGPPLAVPLPPERVIVPSTQEPEVATAPPVIDAPAPVSAPPPPRAAGSARPPQASPPPAAAIPVPTPVAPVAEAPRVTRPTAADLAEEKRVGAILQRARTDISRIVPNRLSTDGRAQFEQSKRLAEQAEEAIKDRNWPFAETLADKAATLAAELLAR